MLCLNLNFFRRQKNKERRDNMSNEFENKVLEKLESFDKKFDVIDQKFEAIDKRFDTIDKRFETIDKKFESIDKRFDEMDAKFNGRSSPPWPIRAAGFPRSANARGSSPPVLRATCRSGPFRSIRVSSGSFCSVRSSARAAPWCG